MLKVIGATIDYQTKLTVHVSIVYIQEFMQGPEYTFYSLHYNYIENFVNRFRALQRKKWKIQSIGGYKRVSVINTLMWLKTCNKLSQVPSHLVCMYVCFDQGRMPDVNLLKLIALHLVCPLIHNY